MSEMVERVAQAIYGVSADMIEGGWDNESDIRKGCWLEDARAAIEAMREPTEEMIEASGERRTHLRKTLRYVSDVSVKQWQAMIDAALQTEPEKRV